MPVPLPARGTNVLPALKTTRAVEDEKTSTPTKIVAADLQKSLTVSARGSNRHSVDTRRSAGNSVDTRFSVDSPSKAARASTHSIQSNQSGMSITSMLNQEDEEEVKKRMQPLAMKLAGP